METKIYLFSTVVVRSFFVFKGGIAPQEDPLEEAIPPSAP